MNTSHRAAWPVLWLALLLLALNVGCRESRPKDKERPFSSQPTDNDLITKGPLLKMSKAVVAALRARDVTRLHSMMSSKSPEMEQELSRIRKISGRCFSKLLKAMDADKIDLARASFIKARSKPGISGLIKTIDVFLSHQGRVFRFHINVMGRADNEVILMGISCWFKWDKAKERA